MKEFLMGIMTASGIVMAIGAAVIYSGAVDVSADTPHSRLVFRLIETTRERAIDRNIRGLAIPADLADAERVRRGAGNYAAMCVACHLAPGQVNSEIRMGLYPTPPDLARAHDAADVEPARQFWIIKHGIKASGMAAWSKGGVEDAAIWDLVALLQRLPTLSARQYHALVETSEGHSHGGLPGADSMHGLESSPLPSAGRADTHEHSHSDDHDR